MEELRVVITADASGVGPGVAAATAAVQSSADQIAAAQLKATAATKALTEAQIQLGAAAEGGNAQAQGIIAEYAAASAAATASVDELTGAVAAQTPVMIENAAATSAAAAATNVLGVSARQGATAGIGILEGRMMSGNRAAAAFLSTTLGLGPAIQAAFPVIGALALGEVLFEIGKKAYDVYEKFFDISNVDDKLIADFQKMQDMDVFNVHSIETATQRLDEAREAATNLRSAADALHESSGHGILQDILGGNTGALATDIGLMGEAKDLANQGGKQTENAIKLGEIQLKQKHDIALATIEADHASDGLLSKEQQITAEHQKRLEIIQENQTYEHNAERALGNTSPGTAGDQMADLLKKQADAEERVARAHLENKENYSEEAAALKLQGADLGAILLFWEKINADGLHNTEVLRAQEELMRSINAKATIKGEGGDTGKALVQPAEITNVAGLGGKQQTPEEAAAQADSAAEQIVEAKERIYQQNLRNIESEERLGLITEHEAAQQELALQRAAEKAESAPLQQRQHTIAPLGTVGLDQQELKEYQDLQKKMDQIAEQGALKREQIAQQEAQKIVQTMRKVSTTFSNDFEHAFNEWATRSKTAGQAFGAMLGQMELQVIDFAIKTVLEHAAMWAELKIENALGNETLKAQNAVANIQQITQDAGTAAANAYKWASAWGGPVAGAAAAAIAFTAVEAFGIFDSGGMMPHMGFAMNTSGSPERILSPSQTANFESMVNNGGSSRSAVLHQTNNFSGGVNSDMLKEHRQQTLSDMRRLLRPEAFA